MKAELDFEDKDFKVGDLVYVNGYSGYVGIIAYVKPNASQCLIRHFDEDLKEEMEVFDLVNAGTSEHWRANSHKGASNSSMPPRYSFNTTDVSRIIKVKFF